MKLNHGVLTVSLDFELYWGVRDKRSIEEYEDNLLGVEKAVHEILRVFSNNDIHATWATVGFLFFNDYDHLKRNLPKNLPKYLNEKLSPYKYIEESDALETTYHFAPELIELIKKYRGQEIATHTLSHYYCIEEGQTIADFREDISLAISIAKSKGISIKSLVFPRNQWREDYLSVLTDLDVQSYRGTESNWIYEARDEASKSSVIKRAIRLMDRYLNISGHHTYDLQDCTNKRPFNFPSSRFLCPYSKKRSILDGLRLRRITKAMDYAAANKKIFHLWWHPHNFGFNTSQNISFLEKTIEHYNMLRQTYDMKSLNMGELCTLSGVTDSQ